ncbi:MAG: crossover junction endodeoxyribonuclease RuvC [Candidatus Shikimatogenerans sp. Ttur]|uniref:Crossover junction endodeoxyribonuclease RuvC n=1 Tax=Candidatus Shikimatogenerans sp. Ttur TaxID=3158569 RepID=A0AAU7ZXE2_9FLAO
MFKKQIKILGIDPGYYKNAYCIIKFNNNKKKIKIIKLYNLNLSKKNNNNKKLFKIYNITNKIIKKYKPNIIIIERPFLGKNIKTLIKLSKIQTIFILLSNKFKIKIIKYYPKQIKFLLTKNGNCKKNDIYNFLKKIKFNNKSIKFKKKNHDINDSLAIALSYLIDKKLLNNFHLRK